MNFTPIENNLFNERSGIVTSVIRLNQLISLVSQCDFKASPFFLFRTCVIAKISNTLSSSSIFSFLPCTVYPDILPFCRSAKKFIESSFHSFVHAEICIEVILHVRSCGSP